MQKLRDWAVTVLTLAVLGLFVVAVAGVFAGLWYLDHVRFIW